MNIGRRVADLRTTHGDSLREAAERTGVSHSTIARIEKGAVTASFDETLRKIADGYDVPLERILSGRRSESHSPTASLRWQITSEERATLIFTPGWERIRRAVAIVTQRKPGRPTPERLAAMGGVDLPAVEMVLAGDEAIPEPLAQRLQETLAELTDLSPLWFGWSMAEGNADTKPPEEWVDYMHLAKKCWQADLHPDLVEMAIDLLHLTGDSQTDQDSMP